VHSVLSVVLGGGVVGRQGQGAVIGFGERIERKEWLWVGWNPFNLFWKSVDSDSLKAPTNARRHGYARQTGQDTLRSPDVWHHR
jgi:hypothetical protein